jgi:hypothetical protein
VQQFQHNRVKKRYGKLIQFAVGAERIAKHLLNTQLIIILQQ